MRKDKAHAWDWDNKNPPRDRNGEYIRYFHKDINGKAWKCSRCKGIYFKVNDENLIACYSCGRLAY